MVLWKYGRFLGENQIKLFAPPFSTKKWMRLCLPADYNNNKLFSWNQKNAKDYGNPWVIPNYFGLGRVLINTGTDVFIHDKDYSCVLDLPFEEGSGTITKDQSGFGNHGTIQHGATWTTGIFGKALSFDGSARVLVNDHPSLNPNAITISVWVYPTTTERRGIIVKNRNIYENRGYIISTRDMKIWLWIAGNRDRYSINTIRINSWSHIVVTIERVSNILSNYQFYINGVLDSSGTINFGLTPSPEVLGIGDSWWGASRWKGLIDEVKIYNRILSAGEIADIYKRGLTRHSNYIIDKANKKLIIEPIYLDNDLQKVNAVTINNCNSTTNWSILNGSGTLAIDTNDKIEGTGSLYASNGLSDSSGNLLYSYNPTSLINLSDKEFLEIWIKVVESGTYNFHLVIVDSSGNWRRWNGLDTTKYQFSGGNWVRFVLPIQKGSNQSSTSPNLANIDYIVVGIVSASPNTAYTLKIDDLCKDVGQWVKCEVFVPDVLISPKLKLFAYNQSTGAYRTTPFLTDISYNESELQFLDGYLQSEILPSGKGGAFYDKNIRGQTQSVTIGDSDAGSITYSNYYGCKYRIGFAIKMPPDDGKDSATYGISQCKLKLEVYYGDDEGQPGGTTYEFENSTHQHYGLQNINKQYIILFKHDESGIIDFLQESGVTINSLAIKSNHNEEIYEVEIGFSGVTDTKKFWGQCDENPSVDSDNDGIPDFIENIEVFVDGGGWG